MPRLRSVPGRCTTALLVLTSRIAPAHAVARRWPQLHPVGVCLDAPLTVILAGRLIARITSFTPGVHLIISEVPPDNMHPGGAGLIVGAGLPLEPRGIRLVVVAVVDGRLGPARTYRREVLTSPAQDDPIERRPVIGQLQLPAPEEIAPLRAHHLPERRERRVALRPRGEVLVVALDIQFVAQEAARDQQPAPVVRQFGGITGPGHPVQSRLAPLKSQLVLPGIRQHLRHVIEDPQVATPTRTVVELGPQHPLGSVGLHVTPQRIQLLDNADLSVPAGLTPEPRRTAKQHQSPLALAAAGRVPPGVHQRTRLLKITGIPHGPLLTLGRGRLTPQPGKENLVRGACDISRRRSVHTPNLPMPTRARTTGNRPPAKIQIADGDQHRHRGALFRMSRPRSSPAWSVSTPGPPSAGLATANRTGAPTSPTALQQRRPRQRQAWHRHRGRGGHGRR